MPKTETEKLIEYIGQLLAEDAEYPMNGTLLYAQVDRNYVSPSIFKDRGNHILYREPDLDRLGDALLDLWEAQRGEHRWAEVQYFVRDGGFELAFVYPDELGPDDVSLGRRAKVVKEYFGDKPVLYTGPDGEDVFVY